MEILNLNYQVCKKCGAYHDDGTFDLCLQCLDNEQAKEKNKATPLSQLEIMAETNKKRGM